MKNKHDWACTILFLAAGCAGLIYATIAALVS